MKQYILMFMLMVVVMERGTSLDAAPPQSQSKAKTTNPWETPARLTLFMTDRITHAGLKAGNQNMIVTALAEAGEFKQALEVTQQIEAGYDKVAALSAIASVQATTGRKEQALATLKQAMEMAQKLEDTTDKELATRDIIWALTDLGDYQQALGMTQEIESAHARVSVFRTIASALIKAGDKKKAVEFLKQAVEAAQPMAATYKILSLNGIALYLAEAGDKKQALAILNQCMKMIPQIQDFSEKQFVRTTISVALIKVGDKKQALESLPRVVEEAKKIEEASFRVVILTQISVELFEAGDKEQAMVTLKLSLKIAKKIKFLFSKNDALISIAKALEKIGDKKQVLETLKDAVEVAQQNDQDRQSKGVILSKLALTLATELIPENKNKNSGRRMKKTFTPQEKQLAKQLVKATQGI